MGVVACLVVAWWVLAAVGCGLSRTDGAICLQRAASPATSITTCSRIQRASSHFLLRQRR